MKIEQCSLWCAKMPLVIGRCKPKQGDLFWVTTATYRNTEVVSIQRKGKGTLGSGYQVTVSQLLEFFNFVE
jgi:hypothetical protein